MMWAEQWYGSLRSLLRSRTLWLSAAGILVVAALTLLVINDGIDPFDEAVTGVIRQPALRDLLAPLALVTELGATWMVTGVAIAAVLVLSLRGNPRWGALSGSSIAAASLANAAFKRWIARERPDALDPLVIERGLSFPSGHAMLGMTAWGIVAVVVARSDLPAPLRRGIVAGCGVAIFLIGLSRVYLGVHYPSDVLAGWTAGAVIVLGYAAAVRRLAPPHLADPRVSPPVLPEPAAAVVDADRAPPRSDPPAAG